MPTLTAQHSGNHPAKPEWTPPVSAANLSESDAAFYVGLSTSFLRKARRFGDGPPYFKIGRRVIYAVADLQVWLASHRVSHSS